MLWFVLFALLAMLAAMPAHASDAIQTGDAARPRGADLVPNPLCIDGMDYTPDYNAPDPFDADSIAFHPMAVRRTALPAAWRVSESGCADAAQRLEKI